MEKILIVDDTCISRGVLRAWLEDFFICEEAENGVVAVDMITNDKYSCILLDLMMPEMDGFGVLKFMREHDLLEKTPVIVLTGSTDDATRQRCLKEGVHDFLEKPYRMEAIKAAVNRVIEKSKGWWK